MNKLTRDMVCYLYDQDTSTGYLVGGLENARGVAGALEEAGHSLKTYKNSTGEERSYRVLMTASAQVACGVVADQEHFDKLLVIPGDTKFRLRYERDLEELKEFVPEYLRAEANLTVCDVREVLKELRHEALQKLLNLNRLLKGLREGFEADPEEILSNLNTSERKRLLEAAFRDLEGEL
jgi:hypothetical protein